MKSAISPATAYLFGPFRLCVADRILARGSERIQLTPKIIDTLLVLVENHGQVVSKEALMKAVWPDVTVVESGLTRNISVLRKAIEEGQQEGAYLETIPKRGYRFVAEVKPEVEHERIEVSNGSCVEHSIVLKVKPAMKTSGRWLAVAACVAALAGIAGFAALTRADRSRRETAVEPSVRIGDHLLYKLAPEETMRAAERFEQAAAENPRSAGAHAGLSIARLQLTSFGVLPPAETMEPASAHARRALELDPDSSVAHYAMAMVHTYKDWDFPSAESQFRRAIELAPNSVQVRLGYARLKLTTVEFDEAQRLSEEALHLDPASPPLGVEYCRVFYFKRDYRRAESECRKVLDREPGYALAHYYLALSLGMLGRMDEAERSLNDSGLMPGVLEADRAWLALRRGDRRPAVAALEARRELMRRGKVDATAKLLLAAVLDRQDEVYEAIEAGLASRAPEMLTLHIEPRLDSIRADARYPGALARVGVMR